MTSQRSRVREAGLSIGELPTSPHNAITDVAGGRVGLTTSISGVRNLKPGFEQVREIGVLESPIALTNTLNVGLVADALVQHAVPQNPEIGITTSSVNVVVGETNDG